MGAGELHVRSDLGTVLHAFLWVDGVAFDLNTLAIQGAEGWILESATDINDIGMILGRGTIGGRQHDFVLIPTSFPTSTISRTPDET